MDSIGCERPLPSIINNGMIRSLIERIFSSVIIFEKMLDLVLLNRVSGKDGETE
jgi:hypothetical protein